MPADWADEAGSQDQWAGCRFENPLVADLRDALFSGLPKVEDPTPTDFDPHAYLHVTVEEALGRVWVGWDLLGTRDYRTQIGLADKTIRAVVLRHRATGVWVGTKIPVMVMEWFPQGSTNDRETTCWNDWDARTRFQRVCQSVLDSRWAVDPDEFVCRMAEAIAHEPVDGWGRMDGERAIVAGLLGLDPAACGDERLAAVVMMAGLGGYDNIVEQAAALPLP